MAIINVVLLNLTVMSLLTEDEINDDGDLVRSYVTLTQIWSIEPEASGLAYFLDGSPILMRKSDGEICMPGEEWPRLMYVYKPGVTLTELKEPEEMTVDDNINAMKSRIETLEKDVKTLKKKLDEEVNDLKKRIPKPNLSKHKFRQLCRDNKCANSITYNDACFEKWKQSGGGSFFVLPHDDKPSTSQSKHYDGWSDSSYHHSYNDHRGYYGNHDHRDYYGN